MILQHPMHIEVQHTRSSADPYYGGTRTDQGRNGWPRQGVKKRRYQHRTPIAVSQLDAYHDQNISASVCPNRLLDFGCGQLLPHFLDCCLVVVLRPRVVEDSRSRNEHVRARLRDFLDVGHAAPTIHLVKRSILWLHHRKTIRSTYGDRTATDPPHRSLMGIDTMDRKRKIACLRIDFANGSGCAIVELGMFWC